MNAEPPIIPLRQARRAADARIIADAIRRTPTLKEAARLLDIQPRTLIKLRSRSGMKIGVNRVAIWRERQKQSAA